ncbi:MAG: hypothetical protein SFX19_08965, partial [Alphaproteobacteria bacterium]|nr:hypothetical protein [Alphaproteobacteria bacterium]
VVTRIMNEAKTAGYENRRAVYMEVHEQRKRSNRLFAAIQKRVTALSNNRQPNCALLSPLM